MSVSRSERSTSFSNIVKPLFGPLTSVRYSRSSAAVRSSYWLLILPWLKAEEEEESDLLRRRLLFFFLRLLFLLPPPPRFASAGETKRRTTKESRRTDNNDLLMIDCSGEVHFSKFNQLNCSSAYVAATSSLLLSLLSQPTQL